MSDAVLTDAGEVRSATDSSPQAGPQSMPATGSESFDDAVRLHQQGQVDEAERIYQQFLQAEPNHAGALHLLGVVRQQQGDFEAARESIGRAIAQNPNKAVYWNNYGAALQSLGRPVEALACFHHALGIRPRYADALSNQGKGRN
jgi:protein O-GlcNAc transferase